MKTKTNLWMATLTLTAILLGVILLSAPPREAQGAMLYNQTGVLLMTAGPASDEVVVIIDKNSQKMLEYRLKGTSLELVSSCYMGPTAAGR